MKINEIYTFDDLRTGIDEFLKKKLNYLLIKKHSMSA